MHFRSLALQLRTPILLPMCKRTCTKHSKDKTLIQRKVSVDPRKRKKIFRWINIKVKLECTRFFFIFFLFLFFSDWSNQSQWMSAIAASRDYFETQITRSDDQTLCGYKKIKWISWIKLEASGFSMSELTWVAEGRNFYFFSELDEYHADLKPGLCIWSCGGLNWCWIEETTTFDA